MANPYGEIFRAPGTKGFAAAALFARAPMTMAPIGIVAMLSQTHGGYWLAGAVSASFALTNALIAPQVSRLVDRLGQSRVVAPAAAVSVAAFLVLIAAANGRWPIWTLFASALLAAAMPSMPAMVRARWTEIFRGRPQLRTAFAFESAADELVYIMGASLSVGLSVSFFPEAGMLTSTALLAAGTAAFLMQRGSEPRVRDAAAQAGVSAIRLPAVRIVTLALVFVGATFATAEVSVVAITEELGRPAAATFVIGVYAVGSFLVGIAVGAVRIAAPIHRQLVVVLAVLAATQVPLVAATGSVPLLALAVFLSGVAISPTFITAFGLIERRVPEAMLTEGVTWVTTGIGIGMAVGSAATGWVVDTFGAGHVFFVSVAAGAAAFATVLLGQGTLAGERPAAGRCPVKAAA